ncbi:hypothetical protein A3D77_04715 [Candidatus Gottesmanbacteria bacterium RIFCSPHIGHO2_02_FULL_39_11]|uniref:Membrane protein 6-pyruvoyl-tetrahydropterin synthase-related domain-containing protein n=1 Tax=Candidatus Gottesmanbacteria bacterium RIFCSPHIGHO2_02_FULL_39_11 TaxID=1798382 RepID=A0A1F5ZU72_9BACT|nr:MAG: hypothetical protein A3D77_04715 [Candidatus Gottesmanbacteria bacterium RIFCSPHIGHO2_02_FULL_39_11]
MKKRILPFLVLLVLLIILIIPLFKSYIPGTTDGLAHKFRLVSFEKSLQEGNIRPRWLGDSALGYGSPVFLYNYLLPYYVISGIHLFGFSVNVSVQIFEALTLILSAIGMYLLVNLLWGEVAAVSAAVLYAWSPHHLLTIFLSEAWGEMTSFVFPPWIFFILLLACRFLDRKEDLSKKNIVLGFYFILLVLLWVLFILSYNIMALIFSIIYILYILVSQKKKFISTMFLLFPWGNALIISTFFWLPAVSFMQFISYPQLISSEMQQLYLHMYSFTYQLTTAVKTIQEQVTYYMDFSLGIPILLLSFASSIFVLIYLMNSKKRKKDKHFLTLIATTVLFWICVFMANPISTWIWLYFPLLQFVVYPVRFLIPATFAGSIAGGFLLKDHKYWAALFIFLAVISGRPYTIPYVEIFPFPDTYFYQPQPVFHPPITRKNMAVTEFLPVWVNPDFLPEIEQNYYLSGKLAERFTVPERVGHTEIQKNNAEEMQAAIFLQKPATVTVNTFYS